MSCRRYVAASAPDDTQNTLRGICPRDSEQKSRAGRVRQFHPWVSPRQPTTRSNPSRHPSECIQIEAGLIFDASDGRTHDNPSPDSPGTSGDEGE